MELNKEEVRVAMAAIWGEAITLTRIERHNELLPPGKERLRMLRDLLIRMEPESGIEMTAADRVAVGL